MIDMMKYTIAAILLVGISYAESRTCRVVYPERPNDAPKMAHLFDGKDSTAITLPSMNLSEVIKLPKGDISVVMTQQKITDPEQIPAAAPKVNIPENVSHCYIIIMPDPKNPHFPVKLNLVDAGDAKFKAGETLWYNFTEHRILAKLGNVDFDISPKGRAISKPPQATSGYYVARFAYMAQGTQAAAPITEQSWWHDADHKHVGFMANTGGKLPKIYYFRDFRMKEEDEQAPPVEE